MAGQDAGLSFNLLPGGLKSLGLSGKRSLGCLRYAFDKLVWRLLYSSEAFDECTADLLHYAIVSAQWDGLRRGSSEPGHFYQRPVPLHTAQASFQTRLAHKERGAGDATLSALFRSRFKGSLAAVLQHDLLQGLVDLPRIGGVQHVYVRIERLLGQAIAVLDSPAAPAKQRQPLPAQGAPQPAPTTRFDGSSLQPLLFEVPSNAFPEITSGVGSTNSAFNPAKVRRAVLTRLWDLLPGRDPESRLLQYALMAVLNEGLERTGKFNQYRQKPVALAAVQVVLEDSIVQSRDCAMLERCFESRFGGSMWEALRNARCGSLVALGALGGVTHALARMDVLLGPANCILLDGSKLQAAEPAGPGAETARGPGAETARGPGAETAAGSSVPWDSQPGMCYELSSRLEGLLSGAEGANVNPARLKRHVMACLTEKLRGGPDGMLTLAISAVHREGLERLQQRPGHTNRYMQHWVSVGDAQQSLAAHLKETSSGGALKRFRHRYGGRLEAILRTPLASGLVDLRPSPEGFSGLEALVRLDVLLGSDCVLLQPPGEALPPAAKAAADAAAGQGASSAASQQWEQLDEGIGTPSGYGAALSEEGSGSAAETHWLGEQAGWGSEVHSAHEPYPAATPPSAANHLQPGNSSERVPENVPCLLFEVSEGAEGDLGAAGLSVSVLSHHVLLCLDGVLPPYSPRDALLHATLAAVLQAGLGPLPGGGPRQFVQRAVPLPAAARLLMERVQAHPQREALLGELSALGECSLVLALLRDPEAGMWVDLLPGGEGQLPPSTPQQQQPLLALLRLDRLLGRDFLPLQVVA